MYEERAIMSSDDEEKSKKGSRNNPWGNHGGNVQDINAGKKSSSGRGKPSGSGQPPPDLDALLKNAKNNFNEIMPGDIGGGSLITLGLLVLLALWASSGLYIVNPGENAVIQRFGAWNRTQAESGLGYHLPAPFETRRVINVEEIQNLTIGFINGAGQERVSGRREVLEESLMLTSDRNIVDLHLIIQWNIKSAEDFLFNIYDL
jgi:membrane protease subunit HflK